MPTAQEVEAQDILKSFEKNEANLPPVGSDPNAPVAEAPIAETPVAETPATPVAETPETPKTVTFEEQFKEKFGKSIEEYEAETKTPKKPTFKNKLLEKEYEWVEEKGGDPEEFRKIHGTDWDKADNDAVLLAQMKKDNPDLSPEEINDLYAYKYKTDEDKYSEEEIKVANILKKQDALKAKSAFKAMQEAAKVPSNYNAAEQAKETERIAQLNWEKDVDNSLASFNKYSEKIKTATGLEVGFEYTPDATELKELKELMHNPSSIFQSYLNKEGKIDDMNRFITDMMAWKHRSKMMQNLVAQTEDTFVKSRLKNTDFKTNHVAQTPPTSVEQERRRLAEQHFS